MTLLEVLSIDHINWQKDTAILINDYIVNLLDKQGTCNVMLTGGRSAEKLYDAWSKLPEFSLISNTTFYFSDERCVPADSIESNYGLVMRTLFRAGLPNTCTVVKIDGESHDYSTAAIDYENKLPSRLDILLLSVGYDGHIASLFPDSDELNEVHRRVVAVRRFKSQQDRITITRKTIAQAKKVFVLAIGREKIEVMNRAKISPKEFRELPARLVLNATWIVEKSV